MQLLKPTRQQGHWYGPVILLAVLSLAVSLATRFAVPCAAQTHTMKSVSRCLTVPQRQRLIRDAAQWVAPVVAAAFVEPVPLRFSLEQPELHIAIHLFDDLPHYRPPPSLELHA